jgi:peptide deformylase
MAVLEIVKYPEKILREKTCLVEDIDADTQILIDNMIETMYSAHGVGLAANQVGISKRLCVIDVSSQEEQLPLLIIINPRIIQTDGIKEAEEGCLSIPGYMSKVKRAEKVFVKGLNRKGDPVEIEAEGLLAKAIQHEIDHLEGLLFIDRMSPLKREFFKRRYKKSLKSAGK